MLVLQYGNRLIIWDEYRWLTPKGYFSRYGYLPEKKELEVVVCEEVDFNTFIESEV